MGKDVLIMTERELRGVVSLDIELVDVIERAFTALAEGGVVMPPILSMALEAVNGELDVKTAYLPGCDGIAVKISPGFFNNPKIGLPSLNGLMVLLSAQTGQVEAVFLDNGYLTDMRTAAAGAVAARHLAKPDLRVAAVLGAGVQARLQMRAAHAVRPFTELLVWGRDGARAQDCASELARDLGVRARVVDEPEEAVRQAELVVTTTPARAPLIEADWLHPGLHITAMGSDAPGKTEIAPEALAKADLYICDRVSQCRESGELEAAYAAGLMDGVSPPELGEIIQGTRSGRTDDTMVTICDLTGTGAQDTAIATHVMRVRGRAGTVIATE